MSGTPNRADEARLILAKYWGPDEAQRWHLQADVTATYLEGVREACWHLAALRGILCDAKALREYLDGESENLRLADMERGFMEIIEDPEYLATYR